jgi:uncharacterized protein YacL (UPF0231 family)
VCDLETSRICAPYIYDSNLRVKAGGRTIHCEIHKFIIAIWNKEELREEWKKLIIVPTHKKDVKTLVIIEASQFVSYIK